MARRSDSGSLLQDLVALAVPFCCQAELLVPRTGPGRRPDIPDWLLAVLIMVAVLKRKKTKSAQYCFLCAHRDDLALWIGDDRFPSRSTYFDRYRRGHRLFKEAIRLQGQQLITEEVVDPEVVAVDKSLLDGLGPPWHKSQRDRGEVPAGVDVETTWGYSDYHGWVQGYSYEVVVTASAGSVVCPLLVSADTASASEASTFADKIPALPPQTKYVDADSGYDVDDYAQKIEEDERGKPTGRRFLCPENPRNGTGQRPGPAAERRRKRRAFLKSRRGRKIYRRRGQTVEPFHERLSRAFELERAWHRGLDNNRTQVLAAVFAYQVLLRYNHRLGRPVAQVKDIVDRL